MARRFLDGFHQICDQPWSGMTPRGEGRHCAKCDQVVIDLTRLTKKQAQPYVQTKQRICVRAFVDENGEAVFRPEPRKAPGLLLAAALATGCASAAVRSADPVAVVEEPVAQGDPMQPAALPVGIAAEEIDPDLVASAAEPVTDELGSIGPEHRKRLIPVAGGYGGW